VDLKVICFTHPLDFAENKSHARFPYETRSARKV